MSASAPPVSGPASEPPTLLLSADIPVCFDTQAEMCSALQTGTAVCLGPQYLPAIRVREKKVRLRERRVPDRQTVFSWLKMHKGCPRQLLLPDHLPPEVPDRTALSAHLPIMPKPGLQSPAVLLQADLSMHHDHLQRFPMSRWHTVARFVSPAT